MHGGDELHLLQKLLPCEAVRYRHSKLPAAPEVAHKSIRAILPTVVPAAVDAQTL